MAKTGESYIGSDEQRTLDIMLATGIGIGGIPILGAAAIAMGLEHSSLFPFFRQMRVGKNGRTISIVKLRTIPGQDYSGMADLGGCDHPRATLLGKVVRKTGVDELPQILNVLKGELHMAGIRPQIPTTLEQRRQADPKLFDEWIEWARINPGLFGPGQNLAHQHGPYSETDDIVVDVMRADIAFCENASARNDLRTIAEAPLSLVRATLSGIVKARHSTRPA